MGNGHAKRLREFLSLVCETLDAAPTTNTRPRVPTWASWTRLASAAGAALVLVNCDGPSERSVPAYGIPTPPPETNCADGVDENGDGATDCEDISCRDQCDLPEAGRCNDGYDNDHDGDTDGCDSECPNECRDPGVNAAGGNAGQAGAGGAVTTGEGGRTTNAGGAAGGEAGGGDG